LAQVWPASPLSMPWLAPLGKTMITVDIGCEVGDDMWNMPEEQLGTFCLEHLQPIIPGARARYLGCRVLRTPIAYPVFLREYEDLRQRAERSTGIEGLYSIGRNGEFAHIFMEDVYFRTLKKMRHVAERASGHAAFTSEVQ
jgi:protoporphyrinogen/coproporphyrinogen III oxidase